MEAGAMSILSDPRDRGGPEHVPVAELLNNASRELRALCSAATAVETAVGSLITTSNPRDLAELRGLQELDRLIQHIDGLADYIGALARAADGLGAIDAAAARRLIKVRRLADGLAGLRPCARDDGFELL
ncbi:MAG: hypothetical protein COW75_01105 [Rhodobacterales bacterium CG18_big_fil_WC_8_21_14_2_50_71_9]|nr:MAG: hypothetical protein COW75_01105 [Rhodobacterales bacterium CG18_big_fil_WC_8_21_14_2_50_71_9]PIY74634.1 MAG: hypothetical protein COY86_01855 [Rhodobacterales bacterium CG_4_10_14_0_8_um_filter_70_9]